MPLLQHLAAMLTCAAGFLIAIQTHAGQSKTELQEQYPGIINELNNSMEGRQFIIAIPPNESSKTNIQTVNLKIAVTSRFNTSVSMEIPGFGIGPIVKQLDAGGEVLFSEQNGELPWSVEVRDHEVVSNKGIVIRADEPVSVRVFSYKRFSSDAFMVRPTVTWGREYRHIAYYDYVGLFGEGRGGGFVVVAQENGTNVTVDLRGTRVDGTTVGGKVPGESFSFTLNRADTYLVKGNGEDRAFDLTGSSIRANGPISIVSFHERAVVPIVQSSGGSSDMLAAMPPPIEAAGSRFVTRELPRENRGDYFRIMALEDNTNVEVKYYDVQNNLRQIGSRQAVLSRAGDFAEYEEVQSNGGSAESVRGLAFWTSNKPTILVQYAYTSNWDDSPEFDPFAMNIAAVEQFMPADTYLQAVGDASGSHKLQLMVQLPDETGNPSQLLDNVILAGRSLTDLDPRFPFRRIPGSNIYSAQVIATSKPYRLNTPYKTAAVAFGLNQFGIYGHGDMQATNFLHTGDVTAPRISRISDSENKVAINIEAQDGRPEDSGLAAIELIHSESVNAQISYFEDLSAGGFKASGRVRLFAIDARQDAQFLVLARDRAGNVCTEMYTREGVNIQLSQEQLDFGLVRVNVREEQTIRINNLNNYSVSLTGIGLLKRTVFNWSGVNTPVQIEPGGHFDLTLTYQPDQESALAEIEDDRDVCTLSFDAGLDLQIELYGIGGIPRIGSSAPSFPTTLLGERSCANPAIKVYNTGTYDLTISAMSDLPEPFEFNGTALDFPLVVSPGNEVIIDPVCFAPTEVGTIVRELVLTSDADNEPLHDIPLRALAEQATTVEESLNFGDYFTLAPNPARDHIDIIWHTAARSGINLQSLQINIYDLRGRLQWSCAQQCRINSGRGANHLSSRIPVKHLAPGVYTLELKSGNGSYALSTQFIKVE